MTNENKMKTGVALALGVLAEAEADVVYFQPNLSVSGRDEIYICLDPLHQKAVGLDYDEFDEAPYGSALEVCYWCSGLYFHRGGLDYSEAQELEDTLTMAQEQYPDLYEQFVSMPTFVYSGTLGGFLTADVHEGDTIFADSGIYGGVRNILSWEPQANSYYLGFEVSTLDNTNDCYYGYMQIEAVKVDSTLTLTLHEWAYESEANTPITVGAVPEPATGSLIMMSILLIGVFRKLKFRIYGNR